MKESLLLVEDDDGIRVSLRLALEDRGFVVHEASDGETAVDLFASAKPDAVVLDVMLPGIDGLEACRRIRRLSDVPVIMVSARTDSHDIVAGLEAGADDYVRKPFVVAELEARLRAMRRRGRWSREDAAEIRLGDLAIRPEAGEVEVAGQEVHLTRTEFRLLCELAASPGRVFSREMLLEKVWDYDYFGDARIVDVHVRRLRGKIEQDPSNPQHLVTVRGLGYKLQA
ncbi:MAG: response regulator [Actinomycetales bacterium]